MPRRPQASVPPRHVPRASGRGERGHLRDEPNQWLLGFPEAVSHVQEESTLDLHPIYNEGGLIDAALELERDPRDIEETADLRSPLADANALDDAEVDGGVAVINLSEAFAEISGSDQLIAIAQLVLTATARPGVGQVAFTLGGTPIEVPRGDGSLTSGVVTRDGYRSLAA